MKRLLIAFLALLVAGAAAAPIVINGPLTPGGAVASFDCATVSSGTLAAQYKKGVGQTTGQWNDQTAGAHHLTWTGTPTLSGGRYTCNGTTQWAHAAFTLPQPVTVAIRFRTVTFAGNANVMGGNAVDTMRLVFQNPSPSIAVYNGGDVITDATHLDATGVTFNTVIATTSATAGQGAIRIDGNTAVTGNMSIVDPGGITLCADADNSSPSNVEIAQVCIWASDLNSGDEDSVFTGMNGL